MARPLGPVAANVGPSVESWTRVEFNEKRFVESCAGHTDGVVIAHRFDGTHSPSNADGTSSLQIGVLKAAALQARVPFLIDLETWRLPYLSDADDESFGADARTAIGHSVALPPTPEALRSDRSLQPLVRTAIAVQVGAQRVFAPDFQVGAVDDPWVDVNLQCLALTRALAPRLPVAAWVHVTLEALLDGEVPSIAARYAEHLPVGTTVVLTVSDLRPVLPYDCLATYFRGLSAFKRGGFRLIADRASDVSIPAAATYADGCMLGTRLYRTAPASPIFTSEINPKIPLGYYVGHQGRRVRREDAEKRHATKRLEKCAHPECRAVVATRKSDNLLVRLHNAHETRAAVRNAKALGVDVLAAQWRGAPLKHLRTWAQALDDVATRSAEA
jgi:hypothetical protein